MTRIQRQAAGEPCQRQSLGRCRLWRFGAWLASHSWRGALVAISKADAVTPDYGIAPNDGVPPNHGVTPDHRIAPNYRVTPDHRVAPNDTVGPNCRVVPNCSRRSRDADTVRGWVEDRGGRQCGAYRGWREAGVGQSCRSIHRTGANGKDVLINLKRRSSC